MKILFTAFVVALFVSPAQSESFIRAHKRQTQRSLDATDALHAGRWMNDLVALTKGTALTDKIPTGYVLVVSSTTSIARLKSAVPFAGNMNLLDADTWTFGLKGATCDSSVADQHATLPLKIVGMAPHISTKRGKGSLALTSDLRTVFLRKPATTQPADIKVAIVKFENKQPVGAPETDIALLQGNAQLLADWEAYCTHMAALLRDEVNWP